MNSHPPIFKDLPARGRAIRVMVVDDSLTTCTILTRLLGSEPDLEVISKTSNAEAALSELAHNPADIVLLDLDMPGMGGLEALPKIRRDHPNTQILVVSSLIENSTATILSALSMGAADTMHKPRAGEFGAEYTALLLHKIRALAHKITSSAQYSSNQKYEASAHSLDQPPLDQAPPAITQIPAQDQMSFPASRHKPPQLMAIGASTGGIHAIGTLLNLLPSQFNLPILITQHLPQSFIGLLARQLEGVSSRKTVIAENNMPISGSQIFIAPSNGHLNIIKCRSGFKARITHQSVTNGYMPSIDPMFESVAIATAGHALGIILSGMGRDGVEGAQILAELGGTIFVQDQESSAVWGMPGAVAKAGLATLIQPPEELASSIAAFTASFSDAPAAQTITIRAEN